jgi:glycosidase
MRFTALLWLITGQRLFLKCRTRHPRNATALRRALAMTIACLAHLRRPVRPYLVAATASLCFAIPAAHAHTPAPAKSTPPSIVSIDPPQWWANMPAALLLVRGQNLSGCTFRTSNAALAVTATKLSDNGHWAAIHLGASPASAETIKVMAQCPQGYTSADYSFDTRRAAAGNFAGFSPKDVMYLIMTDRFADGNPANDGAQGNAKADSAEAAQQRSLPRGWHGGDLRGVTDHLDYLQSLGITTVWVTPVYANVGEADSYHGYGATDLYAVDPHYGTLHDLQQLATQLHKRHMKLVLDTVPNHIGPQHPWVKDEPQPDWFHGTKAQHHKALGEFAPIVNPHSSWRDQRDILDGWFADVLPDMNQDNPDAAQYLTQNAIWWIEQTGADGLRIDTFPYVQRTFWHAFHASLHELYPQLTTVGEIFNQDPVITSAFASGVNRTDYDGHIDTGLSTPFDFPTYFALRDVLLQGKPMTRLAEILRQDSLYPHPERLVPFLGNHDTSRFMGVPGATANKLRLGFAILLTMRGMPQIYSGDEIAMPGGGDPDNRHDFPGGFPASDATQSAFVSAQRTADEAQMHDWVQHLLQLRAQYAELNMGEEQMLQADDNTLVYVRGNDLSQRCHSGSPRLLITINKADAAEVKPFETANTALEGCTLAKPVLGELRVSAGAVSLSVPTGATISLWQ